jgi:predicted phosphodiesterase
MRYAILADIHSNLEALTSALGALENKNIDEYICLGDVVGYGADPAECLDIVRQKCKVIVYGNHDYALWNDEILPNFKPAARESALWTRGEVDEAGKTFLQSLEIKISKENFLAVHSAPLFPSEWAYVIKTSDAEKNFNGFDEEICFLGHSHKPAVFTFNDENSSCKPVLEPVSFLSSRLRYIINPGSVGQPRDKDPRACFGVYDSAKREFEIIRVPYDTASAGRKIIKAGLPLEFAVRLESGS